MYLENKKIKINFELPIELQNIVEEIKQFTNKYETDEDIPLDEYVAYTVLMQELEVKGKQYTSAGKITDTEKKFIFDKYNAWR